MSESVCMVIMDVKICKGRTSMMSTVLSPKCYKWVLFNIESQQQANGSCVLMCKDVFLILVSQRGEFVLVLSSDSCDEGQSRETDRWIFPYTDEKLKLMKIKRFRFTFSPC